MPVELPTIEDETATITDKMWQVVLLDDDDHTYHYVIEMLMEIFGHPMELANRMACEVDSKKRLIVEVDVKEQAERKKKRVPSYGPDWRMKSRGSMSTEIEPVT